MSIASVRFQLIGHNLEALERMSRYYPGFLAAFFIVLLRIAIGWHFLYEGCEKVERHLDRQGTVLGRDLSAERDRAVWARIFEECCRT